MSEQNTARVPAYKVYAKFPYLTKEVDLKDQPKVGEHIHFKQAIQMVHEEDYIRLIYLYDIKLINEPIIQSIGPFLLKELEPYHNMETLKKYIKAATKGDNRHYDLECEACKSLTELQASVRRCFLFFRKVVNSGDFIDQEIEGISVILSPNSGPLWANFHSKMLEIYLAHEDHYMF